MIRLFLLARPYCQSTNDWKDQKSIVPNKLIDLMSTYGMIIKSDHIFMFIHNQVLFLPVV